jgi:hypothetical protein
MKSIGY